MPSKAGGIFAMSYILGEARGQGTLFPVILDDLIPAGHMCRVIEAFVGKLDMVELGFVRAEPADTGRPGYDPRDLLKLYLYGYLQQVRSSRRLEAECRRNVEVMWLLGRLEPDYKSIAEFQRMHSEAVTKASGWRSMARRSAPSAVLTAFASAMR
jgi:transposase